MLIAEKSWMPKKKSIQNLFQFFTALLTFSARLVPSMVPA